MSVNDNIRNALESYGGFSINERVYNYLGSLGYTGTISDRLAKYSYEDKKGWQALIARYAGSVWTPADLFSQGQTLVFHFVDGRYATKSLVDGSIDYSTTPSDLMTVQRASPKWVYDETGTLVGYLDASHPEMLVRDDDGSIVMPPVVIGFARTPAVVNGNAILVYARLREDEVARWDGMPGVEVLAQAEYSGKGTSADVYRQIFSSEELEAKYNSVYDRSPRTYTDPETGEEYQAWPPVKFGVMA